MARRAVMNVKTVTEVSAYLVTDSHVSLNLHGIARVDLGKALPQFDDALAMAELTIDQGITLLHQLEGILKHKLEERCAFCDHTRNQHNEGDCYGEPKHEVVDAGGECPCNGFELRQVQ